MYIFIDRVMHFSFFLIDFQLAFRFCLCWEDTAGRLSAIRAATRRCRRRTRDDCATSRQASCRTSSESRDSWRHRLATLWFVRWNSRKIYVIICFPWFAIRYAIEERPFDVIMFTFIQSRYIYLYRIQSLDLCCEVFNTVFWLLFVF